MSSIDRMACTYVRGLSWSLLNWLETTFDFFQNNTKIDFWELTNTLLIDFGADLRKNKEQANGQSPESEFGCTPHSLLRQLQGVFNEDTQIYFRFQNELAKFHEQRNISANSPYSIQRRQEHHALKQNFSVESMMRLGVNHSDKLYYASIYGNIDTMFKDINGTDKSQRHLQSRINVLLTRATIQQ